MGNGTDDGRGSDVGDQIDNGEGTALTILYGCLLVYYFLLLQPVSAAP